MDSVRYERTLQFYSESPTIIFWKSPFDKGDLGDVPTIFGFYSSRR